MDIDALKTFIEVNRCRHFGQAAQNLYVSQSTVSARIKLLEDRVGVPLFVRQRNNIQLTAAGEKLLRYAESIVTTWIRAKQEIGVEDKNMIPFVVGAMPSLWDAVLGNWMSFMCSTMPDVKINAEVHDSKILSRRVLDGTMDLAFVFDNPQSLDFECEEVVSMPLVMVSSVKNSTCDEAVKNNYILVGWGTSFSVSHARYFPELPSPRIHVMLGRIALDYILANGGTAYMAEPMVEELIKNERLFLVKNAPVIKRSVYAIYPHNSEKSDLITHANSYFLKSDK
ncbi:MAG: LysR family transcriptional regulator [Gammaproteobacteria bacterium]|nr:LysR family transcriptional regulator [Gammaproteobacteria bacterium]MCW8987307.1 LysR family transcriptional regulator [Gammaproteobacteria bacterium]